MRTVGLRELKNRLSEYVRRARDGEEVLVTDRGAVVAELGPPRRAGLSRTAPAGLADFATRGLVTIGASNGAAVYPKLPPALTPGRLARLIDGERGEPVSAGRG